MLLCVEFQSVEPKKSVSPEETDAAGAEDNNNSMNRAMAIQRGETINREASFFEASE